MNCDTVYLIKIRKDRMRSIMNGRTSMDYDIGEDLSVVIKEGADVSTDLFGDINPFIHILVKRKLLSK